MASGTRSSEGMGATEIALLLEDCLHALTESLDDASKDTIRRAFSLLYSLLEEHLRPNAREKALLDRSACLVQIQYEFDQRARS